MLISEIKILNKRGVGWLYGRRKDNGSY
jgi:hypothetical protein